MSDFFIGEIESIRKSLKIGNLSYRMKSFGYLTYDALARYGESVSLPLLVWTPSIITLFVLLRTCDISMYAFDWTIGDIRQNIFDSLASFFSISS